ncbi:MAG: VOC family protein [Actinomycetota bacterium]|nr:VOC family protein [Actinomycetota bacterium]
MPSIRDIDLDHVAVAVERQSDAWPRYAGDLSGRWMAGGETEGFASAQVRYANGMCLEVLEPRAVERNDFLRRFLDHSGPGPHHLTFKVGDLGAALAASEAAGLSPVGIDLRDPDWKEAFLHPKQAHGVVVQLAQAAGGWTSPPPEGFPLPRTEQPASLDFVAHAVASIRSARSFFADLLGGVETAEGEDSLGRWVELAWPGPGRIRLVEAIAPEVLAGRPGRVHHLGFTVEEPHEIGDTGPVGEDGGEVWQVAPEHNLGTRLVLRPPRHTG